MYIYILAYNYINKNLVLPNMLLLSECLGTTVMMTSTWEKIISMVSTIDGVWLHYAQD